MDYSIKEIKGLIVEYFSVRILLFEFWPSSCCIWRHIYIFSSIDWSRIRDMTLIEIWTCLILDIRDVGTHHAAI